MTRKIISSEFPFELNGKVDPQLYKRLTEVFSRLQQLEQIQSPAQTQDVVKQQLTDLGLLNILGQPVLGMAGSDPQVSSLPVSPGTGTVTSVDGAGVNNVTITGGPITSTGTLTVTFSLTPTFTTTNVGVGGYEVSGTKVVGAQGAAVPNAAGGATIDAEARTAINDLLARLRTHGLIAT